MKTGNLPLAFALLVVLTFDGAAVTRYVDLNSPSPTPPYTNWLTAATNIQDAIDAADAGDTVLVTNGVYAVGGRAVHGIMTNRVAVDKVLTVSSVNGPAVTTIAGFQISGRGYGAGAIRGVYLADGATLAGFTITNGATLESRDNWRVDNGGGVMCAGGGATVTNCVISRNIAGVSGGGVYGGTTVHSRIINNSADYSGGGVLGGVLKNSALSGNYANDGGAAIYSTLTNCTVTANGAFYSGGGASACNLVNCIVVFNTAMTSPNYSGSSVNYCCTSPLPPTGDGNFDADPLLASGTHLSTGSPCRGRGSSIENQGTDIDGESWLNPPSVGCDEYQAGSIAGNILVRISVSYTNVTVNFDLQFTGNIDGKVLASVWNFGDGTTISNRPFVSHRWNAPGDYAVVLTAFNEDHLTGVASTTLVHVVEQAVYYVSPDSAAPLAPFSSWSSAAHSIQDAVDAASIPGALVLVSNGVYAAGTRVMMEKSSNRVAIAFPINVRSLSGPAETIIQGSQGDTAVRCAFLRSGATLSGFTLHGGGTLGGGANGHYDQSGGGVWCESLTTLVTNCVLVSNTAFIGGGSFGGTLQGCKFVGNNGYEGGGASYGNLQDCVLTGNGVFYQGGGVSACTLDRCLMSSNSAFANGGGAAFGSSVYNSLIVHNSADNNGGGALECTLVNSTLSGNRAFRGGGAYNSTCQNTILYDNLGGGNYDGGTFSYCNTTPAVGGVENFTDDPLFQDPIAGNYHLSSNSPCINAGINAYVVGATDLDGNPRIAGSTVDMGAFEFQSPASVLSYAWAQQYGLPTDGSADFTDDDGDGANHWQEWRADTVPTNAASALLMGTATNGVTGLVVSWASVATRNYWLERGTDLGWLVPFATIATNIPGVAGTKTFNDASATNGGPYFYRVGVQ